MNPIVYAIPVFMLTIVLEAWWAWRKRLPVYDIPDAVTSLHHGLLSQVMGVFTKFGIYALVYESFRATEWPLEPWWLWLVALVFYDFCYYWAHRM
ncbi:MAG: sterol desaturase family protein, partial [Rhodoferax sp.]